MKDARMSFKKEYFKLKANSLVVNLKGKIKKIEEQKEVAALCESFDKMSFDSQAVINVLKQEVLVPG